MRIYQSLRAFAATLPPERLAALEELVRQPDEVHEHPPTSWVGCPGCIREKQESGRLLARERIRQLRQRGLLR